MKTITVPMLQRMWTNAAPAFVAAFVALAPAIFEQYGINTDRRLKHFLGQISHETNGASLKGAGMRESLYYTHSSAMMKAWPKRFPTEASTLPYLRNERALAAKVYNGRMGNREGTDDGYNYRGAGLLQNTGREMFEKLAKLTGIDLVNHPELIDDPKVNITCACIEFSSKCLPAADRDDGDTVSRLVNGGDNGLKERRVWTARWGQVLAA